MFLGGCYAKISSAFNIYDSYIIKHRCLNLTFSIFKSYHQIYTIKNVVTNILVYVYIDLLKKTLGFSSF